MTTTPQVLSELLSPALVRGVGYALLHSLWQGGAAALLLAGALPLLRRARPEVRYAASVAALAGLLLAVGSTFGYYYQAAPTPSEQALRGRPMRQPVTMLPVAAGLAPRPAPPLALLPALARQAEPCLPWLVAAWLLGLLLMGGRLVGGLVVANRLRRTGARALGADWQRRLAALARRAGLHRPVALLESGRVRGPLVLGHLRPVILLPLGAVAGLPPSLLEALLAHELAHIVRRDYLLNLVLSAVEVLFFYHPAVWFMAGCLRAERENCCDDQAAALCGGDRLRVARALAALAELDVTTAALPQLALAATGAAGRGSLLARVRRLALGRPQAPTLGEGLLAVLLGGLGIAGLSTGVALATPASTKATKALLTTVKQVVIPADTTRKPKLASVIPAAPADTMHQQVQPAAGVGAEAAPAPQVRTYSFAQPTPPRRERVSTVVIEKDKKGRVVNLVVDGQPVDTGTKHKKANRSKEVRTVEVVRVPGPEAPEHLGRAERPSRSESRSFSFSFPADEATAEARRGLTEARRGLTEAQRGLMEAQRGLTEALRDPALNEEQRQEMKRELAKLQRSLNSSSGQWNFQLGTTWQWPNTQRQLAEGQRQSRQSQRQLRLRTLTLNGKSVPTDRDAERADREAERADRESERADHEAELADLEGERAEAEARRAELRARIAADAAELRTLEGRAPRAPRVPQVPRVPRAPRVPAAPMAPMAPQVPAPPAPPAAPSTAKLSAALRRDGLIKDDKHYSFELSDAGGRVNGKALTPAQEAKYRQLLGQPASKGKGNKMNFTISVDEN